MTNAKDDDLGSGIDFSLRSDSGSGSEEADGDDEFDVPEFLR